ncbi:alpha-(1-_3)-arabinofuranosyltransferase domain-containing protein [Corynebacterium nuruki]|uniref:alpha-(1->3)-arabinofuranosyltransferase domain-containing protein n=1 Tax=Corynebacterium nuruki TaxID=1032851 RepID=UPI003A5C78AC
MAGAGQPSRSRRGWSVAVVGWLAVALLQSPGLTVADTKHDLVADPWSFLHQALSPWTDVFPLGQLQNQAYGYLFPQGLFFALLDPLPDWLTQRLWWWLLLVTAFAGMLRLLDLLNLLSGDRWSRWSRITGAVLFALSPRILTTLGAISSEAWPVALTPWVLTPLVGVLVTAHHRRRPEPRKIARAALGSAVAVLCLGAVNAVATGAAVLPTVLVWLVAGACSRTPLVRRTAWRFLGWWLPAGVLACFWWVGPLLILGRYSPPFTDFIESAGITTNWFSLGEVLRGTTSWTPYLADERVAGHALVTEPVFVAGTLAVAVLGLWGLSRRDLPWRPAWLSLLVVGLLVFWLPGPFSPVADQARAFLDGAGAPLRNLHKFDVLVHLPLLVGVVHLLGGLRVPSPRTTAGRRAWLHPEANRPVVAVTAVGLLTAAVTAPAWSGTLAPQGGYRSVPDAWVQAADWLNHSPTAADTRTMILPRAATARQTWGNTRDEPAQALLDVPWVVRDAVPLVPPEAIRGLDGVQRAFDTGTPAPGLSAALDQQGVGFILVRADLARVADTPGSRDALRTLRRSPGFTEEASFGDGELRIFRVGDGTAGPRLIDPADPGQLEAVAGGPEVLPRLAEADAAAGRPVRDRILTGSGATTVTDTPARREHSFGEVSSPDSEILATDDPRRSRNRERDYPVESPVPETRVRQSGGTVTASSSQADATNATGADTLSGVNAAVDGDTTTAWRPADGSTVNQWLDFSFDHPVGQLRLTAEAQSAGIRLQAETSLDGSTVATSTVAVPEGRSGEFILPAGRSDRVRLRILGAGAHAGLSEVTFTELNGGRDVTPRRDIVVPAPETGASGGSGGLPRRWVLGQEVPEGTLRRVLPVPADTSVQVTAADCGMPVEIDGTPRHCGDRVPLTAGEHVVRTQARWVSLEVDGAAPDRPVSDFPAGSRLLVTPTTVNPGRSATLDGEDLAPVTVNGWQQGWVIPADLVARHGGSGSDGGDSGSDLAAAVDVEFTATGTYRAWLAAGLAAAVVLVLGWLCSLVAFRRDRSGTADRADGTAGAGEAAAPALPVMPVTAAGTSRLSQAVVLVAGGLGAALFTRGPWGGGGTDGYAGTSWLPEICFLVAVAATLFSRRARRDRHGGAARHGRHGRHDRHGPHDATTGSRHDGQDPPPGHSSPPPPER